MIEDLAMMVDPATRAELLDDRVFKRHIARMKAMLQTHGKETICAFLTQNTRLRGEPFSFLNHEYQQYILEDESIDKVIIKSAQMGISEMSARMAIAYCNLIDAFTTIYTLPSAQAASDFMKTRIDPVIQGSPYLSDTISKAVDNTLMKRFGDSYLYLKGAQVDSQAISVPADMLICDEVDNSNQSVMTLFESRLIHSPYQFKVRLSTPSIPNFGIHAMFNQSRRHMHFCKCTACNHWFEPDYHEHVRVPGWLGNIAEITKTTFSTPDFRWLEAYVACPRCGRKADLSEINREWVCENPGDSFVSTGFRVSPFSCPNVITTASLVKSSVEYERKQDFYNQRLGKPLEDAESTLSEAELREAILNVDRPTMHPRVMGLDMGNYCACTICAVLPDDHLLIIHTEVIPLFDVVRRREELAREFRVTMTVVDYAPYTETVFRMQQHDRNVFAGVYTRSRGIDLFKVKDQEEEKEEGKEALRQVTIVRDKVFDVIMDRIRDGKITKIRDVDSTKDDQWVHQMMDQKRVREYSGDELVFVWKKTQGQDHFHHSLLYALIASRIMAVARNTTPIRSLVSKFRIKNTSITG